MEQERGRRWWTDGGARDLLRLEQSRSLRAKDSRYQDHLSLGSRGYYDNIYPTSTAASGTGHSKVVDLGQNSRRTNYSQSRPESRGRVLGLRSTVAARR